jgi:heme/copper-type cytochrome/quinol oxidase subunit 1
MFVSIAAIATFAAQFIFLFNFFYSMFRGRVAPANPWNSTTLEWTTPRHPQHGNWPGEIPSVYRWPYDYSKPGAKDDFILKRLNRICRTRMSRSNWNRREMVLSSWKETRTNNKLH